MAKSYMINGSIFKTQKDLRSHLKTIYTFYKDGDFLSKKDSDFCCDLLRFHEEYKQKTAGGVKAIRINRSPFKGTGTRCFYIVHDDGTEIDFSYETCIKGYRSQ